MKHRGAPGNISSHACSESQRHTSAGSDVWMCTHRGMWSQAGRAGGSLEEGPGLSGQPGQGRGGGGADGPAPALDIRNLCGNEDRLMLG